ncbi:hypothetical protein BKK44_29455 [Bacillus cereus]|nr:hypothetical protein BKK44_29455 [Bacillus cereus]
MIGFLINCVVGRKIGKESGKSGLLILSFMLAILLTFQITSPYLYTIMSEHTLEIIFKGAFLSLFSIGIFILGSMLALIVVSLIYLVIHTVFLAVRQ